MDVLFRTEQYARVVEKGIVQTVYTLEAAEKLEAAAAAAGVVCRVFVKVDTGLNRIGVKYTEAAALIASISRMPHVEVIGMYATFMQIPDQDKMMLERFSAVDDALCRRGIRVPIKSMASSHAILFHPEGFLDMVRPGLILYGVSPPDPAPTPLQLRQALQLKARIEHAKWVEKGESVTYWGRFTAPKRMRIGTLHLGFYDGLPRELANKGTVRVDGAYRSSVGSVSLNHYLIDLSETQAEKGDEVTVIGNQGAISIAKTAETAGWLPYSLLNHLHPSLPRIYFRGGEPAALLEA